MWKCKGCAEQIEDEFDACWNCLCGSDLSGGCKLQLFGDSADLADQQQEVSDLATENERQIIENESRAKTIALLRADVATHQGRAGQLESDLAVSRDESARERSGAELARTELAKAQLRLEAMPRLEADLGAVREALDIERTARVVAEQAAAVLAAKLDASERRTTEAIERTAQADARVAAARA